MVKNMFIRGIVPFVIMTAITILMNYQGLDPADVRSTFIVGIIIASVAAASVIYEIEGWTLLKQSVVHFIIMLLTVYPCLLISGWFELSNFEDYLRVFGIFITVGIMLWSL